MFVINASGNIFELSLFPCSPVVILLLATPSITVTLVIANYGPNFLFILVEISKNFHDAE